MRLFSSVLFCSLILLSCLSTSVSGHGPQSSVAPSSIFGFRDASAENAVEARFLAVPDPKLAEEHLRTLTQAPHMAGTPEDKATADYVAQKFRAAGLDTEIVEYKVWINYPQEISVDLTAPPGVAMHGPTREHVDGDPYDDDPRVVTPFNGMSPSGDAEAEVVYANYGTPEDFEKLEKLKVDVRGKIVLVRYSQNFRGVKAFIAQEHGAAGVIIYSDPFDDGWRRGDKYPDGPWRPDTGVERGSVGYMFEFPGDPTTPGVASLPSLPENKRIPPQKSAQMPKIPVTPLSYHDAWPILQYLGGHDSPREWQGALPFTYHVGPGPARVKMHLKQDYQYRTLWDVIGRVHGSEFPGEWVVAGNHRDAWVYGAVDPNSGTAAMLESVHGLGALLKQGWHPKRTIVFCSWDAEEEGLIGSTEWVEQHAKELDHAVAYFNVDVAVSGPSFSAAAVPSLKRFIRELTRSVPSPLGATVYDQWMADHDEGNEHRSSNAPPAGEDVHVGDLGSGSGFTPFLQHVGVPSTDIGSGGPYGVYHSTFDDFAWFTENADPHFVYLQEMARVFGLEALRMADADVLPYDYVTYAHAIDTYIVAAERKASDAGIAKMAFAAVQAALGRFLAAAQRDYQLQTGKTADLTKLNTALRQTEADLVSEAGLPNRPWYRHTIYAPGEYTGYAAVVIPGVNEAIESKDAPRAAQQLTVLTQALDRATHTLDTAQ